MGDHASLSVTVYACRREQAAVIDQAMEDLHMELVGPDPVGGWCWGGATSAGRSG